MHSSMALDGEKKNILSYYKCYMLHRQQKELVVFRRILLSQRKRRRMGSRRTRACGRSIGLWSSQSGTITLEHENERKLGLHLMRFAEIIEDALLDLLPNTLCEYLYNLSDLFMKFYST